MTENCRMEKSAHQTDTERQSGIAFLSEDNSVETVLSRFANCENPRLRAIMTSVVRHLHAIVKETEPTFDEWIKAIEFLTKTGQMCDEHRQEWILMSDTLGVSMLVDAINNRKPPGTTQTTVLGPFHVKGAPERQLGDNICLDGKGPPLLMSGRVLDKHGKPIKDARLDVWQSNEDGFYDVQQPNLQPEMNLRGQFTTGSDGQFWWRSARPCYYPIPTDGPAGLLLESLGRQPYRPAHIHFIITAAGHETLVTHLFVRGDPYLSSDVVFGVKEELIIDFIERDDPAKAAEFGFDNPFFTAYYEFVLS